MITKCRLLLLLALVLVLGFGCGTSTRTGAKISGNVKINGKPVTAGSVTIYPSEGGAYSTPIQKDGSYEYGGLPVGEVAFSVETETVNPNRPKPSQYGGKGGAGNVSPMPKDVQPAAQTETGAYVKIPAKYATKETANLTATLKAGANTQDLELKE
jgi:hypothetical protein